MEATAAQTIQARETEAQPEMVAAQAPIAPIQSSATVVVSESGETTAIMPTVLEPDQARAGESAAPPIAAPAADAQPAPTVSVTAEDTGVQPGTAAPVAETVASAPADGVRAETAPPVAAPQDSEKISEEPTSSTLPRKSGSTRIAVGGVLAAAVVAALFHGLRGEAVPSATPQKAPPTLAAPASAPVPAPEETRTETELTPSASDTTAAQEQAEGTATTPPSKIGSPASAAKPTAATPAPKQVPVAKAASIPVTSAAKAPATQRPATPKPLGPAAASPKPSPAKPPAQMPSQSPGIVRDSPF